MEIALMHKHFDAQHLEDVKAEMVNLGAPTIKAVWMECWGVWAALEGCHRIRAAKELGMIPEIEEIEYSEDVTLEELGIDDSGDGFTVAEIADGAYRAKIIKFED